MSYKDLNQNTGAISLSIVEEHNYYPFGLKHNGYNGGTNGQRHHKYMFGGKELQDEIVGSNSFEVYDFGARNYDAALGRWMNIDNVADIAYSWTPYRYGFDNPIKFYDPDGNFETDGHYWTVYLAAILTNHSAPASIAYWAEEPDHIMDISGDIIRGRTTWANLHQQGYTHALTGGNTYDERAKSKKMYDKAYGIQAKGNALHRLGDSYAHSMENGKMYSKGPGHWPFDMETDLISFRPELYLDYVKDLLGTLGNSDVDTFTFDYVANNGGSTEENSAIFETEIRIREGVNSFSVKGDQSETINKYLGTRNKNYEKKYKSIKAEVDVYKKDKYGVWVKGGTETRTFITIN